MLVVQLTSHTRRSPLDTDGLLRITEQQPKTRPLPLTLPQQSLRLPDAPFPLSGIRIARRIPPPSNLCHRFRYVFIVSSFVHLVFFVVVIVVAVIFALHPFGETQVFWLRLFLSLALAVEQVVGPGAGTGSAVLAPTYTAGDRDADYTALQILKPAFAKQSQKRISVVPKTDLAVVLVDSDLQVANGCSRDMAHVHEIEIQDRHL